jgi:hypothetical protein
LNCCSKRVKEIVIGEEYRGLKQRTGKRMVARFGPLLEKISSFVFKLVERGFEG